MVKYIFTFSLALLSIASNAQSRNNAINLQAEVGLPADHDLGVGFAIRGLHGTGRHAQLTISGGVAIFKEKNPPAKQITTTRLVPFLFGYRQNIRGFYIEPQIGLGEMGGKLQSAGDYARPSVAAVFGAIGAGYKINRVNTGMRFQMAHGIEGASAGTWHDRDFHYTSLFIGFDIVSKN